MLVGVVFAYLFLATDIFKSNKELFGKYLTQEMNKIEEVLNFDTIKTYQNLEDETKYESNVNVKLLHS